MREILGNNLIRFFENNNSFCECAKLKYKGNEYEVWEVSDELFVQMCDMHEDEFYKFAGDDAWWRSSEGSIMGIANVKFMVNGEYLLGWDSRIYLSKKGHKYENLSDYLCNCIGVSQPRNVCALVTDLAIYNGMTMTELFEKYEG